MEIKDLYNTLEQIHDCVYKRNEIEIDPQKKTFILLTGTTGAGKDTLLSALIESNDISHVLTATSRLQREGERENSHVWMRQRREGEGHDEFVSNLVNEYGLIEYDYHYDNLYGLPRESLEKEYPYTPVVRTDIKGLHTLTRELRDMDYNTVSVLIVPDSWEDVRSALSSRNDYDEKKMEGRIQEDIKNFELFKQTDIVIHNSRDTGGLQRGIEGLRYVVNLVNKG